MAWSHSFPGNENSVEIGIMQCRQPVLPFEYDEFEKRSSLITIELTRLCILKIVRPSKFQRPLDVLMVLPQINVLWVPGGA